MRKITEVDPEWQRLPAQSHQTWEERGQRFGWWLEQNYYVWLPGADEADVRPAWSTGDADAKISNLDILNELGAAGWEVVSYVVRSSAMGESLGRATAGYPIQTNTLLKRPII